ncbi:MAG: HD-GYP domain-containing protein [Planctomycetota bacterium]
MFYIKSPYCTRINEPFLGSRIVMLGTISQYLSSSRLQELKRFGDKVSTFGATVAVYDVSGELTALCESGEFESDRQRLADCGRMALEIRENQNSSVDEDGICRLGGSGEVLCAVIKPDDDTEPFALLIDRGHGAEDYLKEMLMLFADDFRTRWEADKQIEMVSTELAQTYEELVVLHKLSTNMRVTESDANYLQMACDSLTDIIGVEGIAVLLEKNFDDEKRFVLAAGSGLIDINEHMAAILQSRLAEEIEAGREALLDSEVDSPFKHDWPKNIESIIAVPLTSTERLGAHSPESARSDGSMVGLMVAINRTDKQDFDSTDVKLFNSVANGCAVFIENGRLFKDLKELFIGSLKALTSSIDAKDQYTRGHSERVAFISRWIAERLAEEEPLEEEHIHRIYLAGLLHDIGKVGIDEAVLRKKGKLTEQEVNHIRAHPVIGANILSEIKQMRDIVPGVLCHHERVDGKGYPNGLAGEKIPRIGCIVGLADSFDAMTSKRVYRDALTVDQALAEVKDGLGTQFDENIGRIFINSDIYQLWDTVRDGFAEITM